jgi:hypothetical protein
VVYRYISLVNKIVIFYNARTCIYIYEQFEDTKGVIRIRKLKKNIQHNGQNKKDKRTNNDLQNIHIKLKIEQHEPIKYRRGTQMLRKS